MFVKGQRIFPRTQDQRISLSDMKSSIDHGVLAFFILTCLLFQEAFSMTRRETSPYPPGWEMAASSLDDFPVREMDGRNVTIVDPWLYIDRLGIFKIMVVSTERYFSTWGFNNSGNLLWGLPLQFGWQMTTGRLSVTTPTSHDLSRITRFSPSSWWADMNYFLSIIPFFGALKAGIVLPAKKPLYILKPANVTKELSDKFCSSVTECVSRHPKLMSSWTKFFEHLHEKMVKGETDGKDVTVGLLWAAHTDSIHTGK